jgi:hypothetical protein
LSGSLHRPSHSFTVEYKSTGRPGMQEYGERIDASVLDRSLGAFACVSPCGVTGGRIVPYACMYFTRGRERTHSHGPAYLQDRLVALDRNA